MPFFKQCKFKELLTGDCEIFAGIAAYDGDKLLYVICGKCGGTLEPDDVEILGEYEDWMDLTETIIGDDNDDEIDDDGVRTIVETEPWFPPSQFQLNP